MPFAKRVVSPVRLGRKRISEEDKFDKTVVCNNTLVGVVQQLSSLAYYADELFQELNQECLTVIRRTSRLVRKLEHVEKHIEKLDFKTVKVPAGDLKTYKELSEHFKTEYGLDTLLFAPTSRPDCVIDLYDASALSPIQAIRQCNVFRKDGKTGSKLFSLDPVVREDALYGVDSEVDITSPLHHGDFERKPREPRSVKHRPRSLATLKELEAFASQDDSRDGGRHEFGGPKDSHKSAEILPSSMDLVPIDVTGSGFVRMCEYRESIRTNSREYVIEECSSREDSTLKRRRHRRRQTVSGVPLSGAGDITHGFIVQSETDLRTRSVSRERLERPKSVAYMDRYAPRPENNRKSREELRREKEGSREEPGLARSCSFRRSMRSLFRGDKEKSKSTDLWVQGRPESPGPPMVDLDYPLRRSKSLPRSLKAMSKSLSKLIHSRSASTEGRLDSRSEDEVEKERETRKYGGRNKTPKQQQQQPQQQAMNNAMDQGFVTVVSKSKKPKSLRKNLTKRMSKSQSQVNQTVSGRPPLPLNFTPKHSPRQVKNSAKLARPKSLEFGMVAGSRSPPQQHQPIPANTPLTPSSDGVFTPSPMSSTGALGMKKHRLNIPPGQAWKAFGDIHYRGGTSRGRSVAGERCGERQSSSGHWSATDSSVRYSTESDYPRSSSSPERGSLRSGDRDSAISFNMQDVHNATTDNNPEDDASTVNGDTSMFVDDTSTVLGEDSDDTLNGSVVNAGVKVTSGETSESWVSSLSRTRDTKEMKDRRKRRRSRKDRAKGVTSSPGSLTLTNMRVHDGVNHRDTGRRVRGDEESSVYSQDTDGFYTSMHTDSGLKHSADDLINGMNAGQQKNMLQGTTVPITLHSNAARSDSFKLATGGTMFNKQIPPPPPRRSSTLSKDNRCPSPLASSIQEDELDRILASSFSLNSSKSNDSKESRLSLSISETSIHMDESLVSESDPELIYTRVKDKTSITTAGYPSLCSVTPLNSEDEDRDMLAFSREWRSGATDSMASSEAPTPTPESANNLLYHHLPTSTPMVLDGTRQTLSSLYRLNRPNPALEVSRESSGTERSLDESSMSWEFDISGMDLIDTSVYSTLPRKTTDVKTPTQELDDMGEESKGDNPMEVKPTSFGVATYVPSLRLFNVGSLEDLPTVRESLPQVKTPDKLLDDDKRAISKFSNTFHIPSDHKFTFDTENIAAFGEASPPQKQSSLAYSKVSTSSIIKDKHKVAQKPPVVRKLDKSEAFHAANTQDEMVAGMTATWPRKKDSPCSPKFFDDSELNSSMSPTLDQHFEMDEKSWTNTFPRKKNKKFGQRQNNALPPDTLNLNTSLDQTPPFPAQAQLIISSPIAKQAEYVDNPHKRSLCSPVSEKELLAFSQFNQNNTPPKRIPAVLGRSVSGTSDNTGSLVKKSSTMFEFSSPYQTEEEDAQNSSAFRPVSKPLYPTLSSMKHSISFPETAKEKVNPSNYNRTWYDGVDKDSQEKSETASTETEDRLSQTGYPFAAFLNDSFLSTLESSADTNNKRQSLVSNNSTNSSGSGKKSVTFASEIRLSQNSLNKSDSVSVSSTQTTGTDHSHNSKVSKNSAAGILTSFKNKSLESLKSNDSQKSVHSNESVKLRSGKVVQVDVTNAASLRRTSVSSSLKDSKLPQVLHAGEEAKPKIVTASETNQSSSPQKRSSAIFDDDSSDIDMYTQVMQQHRKPVKKSSGIGSEKTSRSRTDELPPTGLSQTVKRQCINSMPSVKSPARTPSMKKNRLKRTPSKPSVRVRMSGDSCEIINMGQSGSNFSPSKQGRPDQQPFSSIIMKSAPSRVTVTMPFEVSPQKDGGGVRQIGAEPPRVELNSVVKAPVHAKPVQVRSAGNGRVVVNVQYLDDSTPDNHVSETGKGSKKQEPADIELRQAQQEKGVVKRQVSLSSFSAPVSVAQKDTMASASGNVVLETNQPQIGKQVEPEKRQQTEKSAFTEVLKNKENHIRPSPPKFVLPKLRSVTSEPTKEQTKDVAEKKRSPATTSCKSVSKSVHHQADIRDSGRPDICHTSKTSAVDRATHATDSRAEESKISEYRTNEKNGHHVKKTEDDGQRQNSYTGSEVKIGTLETTGEELMPTLSGHGKTVYVPQKEVKESTTSIPIVLPKVGGKPVRKCVSVSDETNEEMSEKENRFVSGRPPPKVHHKAGLTTNYTRPDSSYGSTTSLHHIGQAQNTQPGQSSNPLAKSLTNLSCLSLYRGDSTFSLAQSSYSLARSTDSLASTSSERAEKVKAAKLAFLQKQNESLKQPSNLDDRFAKHTLGSKTLSASRTSLSSKSCVNFSTSSVSNERETNSSHADSNARANVIKPLSTVPQRQQDNNQNTIGSSSNTRTDNVMKRLKTTAVVPSDKRPVSNHHNKPHQSALLTTDSQQKRKSRHLVDNASANPVPGKLISSLLNKFQN